MDHHASILNKVLLKQPVRGWTGMVKKNRALQDLLSKISLPKSQMMISLNFAKVKIDLNPRLSVSFIKWNKKWSANYKNRKQNFLKIAFNKPLYNLKRLFTIKFISFFKKINGPRTISSFWLMGLMSLILHRGKYWIVFCIKAWAQINSKARNK